MAGTEVQTGELMKNKTTKMIEYIRKNKIPIGCLAAVLVDDQIYIGFSLCDKNDEFSKKTARDMAEKRALRKREVLEYHNGKFYSFYPSSIKKNLKKFVAKARWRFGAGKIANYQDTIILSSNKENTEHVKINSDGKYVVKEKEWLGVGYLTKDVVLQSKDELWDISQKSSDGKVSIKSWGNPFLELSDKKLRVL